MESITKDIVEIILTSDDESDDSFDVLEELEKGSDAMFAATEDRGKCTLVIFQDWYPPSPHWYRTIDFTKYGTLSIFDKFLNVREYEPCDERVARDAQIKRLNERLGLVYETKYENHGDLRSLRYGKVMIVSDPHVGGSNFKGLLINYFHRFWPTLLELNFIELLILPGYEAVSRLDTRSFFTMSELLTWQLMNATPIRYTIKTYNYLSSYSPERIAGFLNNPDGNIMRLRYYGEEDGTSIEIAYSCMRGPERREWLKTRASDEMRLKKSGFSDLSRLQPKNLHISYADFIQTELVLYAKYNNVQKIPHMIDGLTPIERKIIFICFGKQNYEIEISLLAYEYAMFSDKVREPEIIDSIMKLSRTQISLLDVTHPSNSNSPSLTDHDILRNCTIKLSKMALIIFNKDDFVGLSHEHTAQGIEIEPMHFIPTIPMLIINGGDGRGSGFRSKILSYDPRNIVTVISNMLNGIPPPCNMEISIKGFKGSVTHLTKYTWLISGKIHFMGPDAIVISALPIGLSARVFRKNVLEPYCQWNDIFPPKILGYEDFCTETNTSFYVKMDRRILDKLDNESKVLKFFQLEREYNNKWLCAINQDSVIQEYLSITEILISYYKTRFAAYERRKMFLIKKMQAEILSVGNQMRYTVECLVNSFPDDMSMENRIEKLIAMKFDSDPLEELMREMHNKYNPRQIQKTVNFNYLVNIPSVDIDQKNVRSLYSLYCQKTRDILSIQTESPANMWREDLNAFRQTLIEIENAERAVAIVERQII